MSGTIRGTAGSDNLTGSAGSEVFIASLGTDTVDGGAGFDVLRFEGLPANYVYSGSTYTDGIPTLDEIGRLDIRGNVTRFSGIERIEFLDATIELSGGSTAAQVNRLYLGLVGRDADIGGLSFWTHQPGGAGVPNLAGVLLASGEFAALHAGDTAEALIGRFYETMLGRTAAGSETAFWAGVAQQQGLAAVAVGIATSSEAAADPLGQVRGGLPVVDPDGAWIGFSFNSLLQRQADLGGFTFFLDAMRGGLDERGVVASIAASAEFQQRTGGLDNGGYVDLLYQDVLHREADAGGRAGYVASLDAGAARADLALAFLSSA